MTIHHFLCSAGIALALLGSATAELEHPSRTDLPVEAKIERLESAARQLAEAGMMEDSVRLRVQAAAMRRDSQRHQPEIVELEATIEALRNENRMLQQRLEELEADAQARAAKTATPATIDQLAAEAHRRQTEETWARIKRAARGDHTPAPVDQEHQLLPPRPIPLPSLTEQVSHPTARDLAILQDILRTLQRIEEKLKD